MIWSVVIYRSEIWTMGKDDIKGYVDMAKESQLDGTQDEEILQMEDEKDP